MTRQQSEAPNAFEQFVQKIAAVPKEAVEEFETLRPQGVKLKRRRTAKKRPNQKQESP